MPRSISSATSIDNLRKEAKRWLAALRNGDSDARGRFERAYEGGPADPVLRDVQYALAREYGHEGWAALTRAVAARVETTAAPLQAEEEYERLANDLVAAYDRKDATTLQRINAHYGRSFSLDDIAAMIWRRVYAFRQRSSKVTENFLLPAEARMLVAQDVGFGSWDTLVHAIVSGTPPIPPYAVDLADRKAEPRRLINEREWDQLLATMRERRLTSLACPMMTDALLAKVATLDHVTHLSLGGSRELTDAGMQHLAKMPQLEYLNLSEYPGGNLTDRGLEALRHLPNLRTFEMTWQRGITDEGAAYLRFCDQLERVDLMGTLTGDGAIAALQGKPRLRSFSTGRLVTDEGLRLLHQFPMLTARIDDGETKLLIDGPFTDAGLASLTGLDGVTNLDLFWHVTGVTADGFAPLASLPNLATLGADGELSDDLAMRHIAAIPGLRSLRAQGSVATDAGFEALSASRTLEDFWGRECPNFGSRGFLALATMPKLRRFGVSCKNVSDDALSALPAFAALREITPIDFTDAGFRHIGRCERLEALQCMYCRSTTDAATEHIAALRLRTYYAGLTLITDRSLAILGAMDSLEQIEFYECAHITDAGLTSLATLPRLRELNVSGSPGVSLEGTRVLPAGVRVRYET